MAAMRPQSYGSSTIGVKKSVVTTIARSSRQPVDRGVVAGVEADEQRGVARRVAEAADEPEHGAQVGGGELAGAARAV